MPAVSVHQNTHGESIEKNHAYTQGGMPLNLRLI